MNTFWFTEINFCPIPTYEGSFPVSDTVFAHSQGFSELYDGKKRYSQVCCDKRPRENSRNENNFKKIPRDRNID